MFGENDQVALTAPIPFEQAEHVPELSPLRESGEGLLPGDVGTIVDVLGKGKAFTVEFLVPDTYGYPVAITTVGPEQLRPATEKTWTIAGSGNTRLILSRYPHLETTPGRGNGLTSVYS